MYAENAAFSDLKTAHETLVYGLPQGLSLAERLPLFCATFMVGLDDFRKAYSRGPSRDALDRWIAGTVTPQYGKIECLEKAAKEVLKVQKDFDTGLAAVAAKWLARGSPPKKKASEVNELKLEELPKPLHAESSTEANRLPASPLSAKVSDLTGYGILDCTIIGAFWDRLQEAVWRKLVWSKDEFFSKKLSEAILTLRACGLDDLATQLHELTTRHDGTVLDVWQRRFDKVHMARRHRRDQAEEDRIWRFVEGEEGY